MASAEITSYKPTCGYLSERLNCRCWLGGMRRLVQLVRRAASHAGGRSTAIESTGGRPVPRQNSIRTEISEIQWCICMNRVCLSLVETGRSRCPRRLNWDDPHREGNDTQTASSLLAIRRLERSGGASRLGALETRLHPDPWTELGPLAFPFLSPGEFGLHGSSGCNRQAGASGGVH